MAIDDLQDAARLLTSARKGLTIVRRMLTSTEGDRSSIEGALAMANEAVNTVNNEPRPGPEDLASWRSFMAAQNLVGLGVEAAMQVAVDQAKLCEVALNAVANQLSDADRGGKIKRIEDAQREVSEAIVMVNSIASDSRALPIEAQVADRHAKAAITAIDDVLKMLGSLG